VFKVLEAVVLVADGGGESYTVVVERTRAGQVAQLMITVGALANFPPCELSAPDIAPSSSIATVRVCPG
jgi:hypothetical protein